MPLLYFDLEFSMINLSRSLQEKPQGLLRLQPQGLRNAAVPLP